MRKNGKLNLCWRKNFARDLRGEHSVKVWWRTSVKIKTNIYFTAKKCPWICAYFLPVDVETWLTHKHSKGIRGTRTRELRNSKMRASAIGNKDMRTRKSEKSKEKSTTENAKRSERAQMESQVYMRYIQRDADLENVCVRLLWWYISAHKGCPCSFSSRHTQSRTNSVWLATRFYIQPNKCWLCPSPRKICDAVHMYRWDQELNCLFVSAIRRNTHSHMRSKWSRAKLFSFCSLFDHSWFGD